MTTPTEFLRLALDSTRLAVLGRAATGPVDADELADALGEQKKKVQLAMVKLREAGLLDAENRLDRQALRELGAQIPQMEPVAEQIVDGPWTAEEAKVLATYFSGNRLQQIPAQQSKRLIVLERFAQEFEPGVRYSERDVNLAIQVMHPDYAAIRRHMVDEGLLTRADGVYWRSGGRHPT